MVSSQAMPPHTRRRLLIGFLLILTLALITLAVASWIASSQLLDPHHYRAAADTEVLALHPGAIVLHRTAASTRPGTYGLIWPGGHGILGAILAESKSSVTRALSSLTGHLQARERVGIDPNVWESNPRDARGIPFRSIDISDPAGPMPAWLVPGQAHAWAIFVHGIDGSRTAGLRILPTLQRAGLPTLLISLRNDLGAPASPDGHVHLGMTEWQDLDAAARYAVAHGAQRLILIGESMGAAIAMRFMHLSRLASAVQGLVLDAPVLDWRTAIDYVASRHHLSFMATPVEWAIAARIPIDWDALDESRQAAQFHVPILLFQGLADNDVPPSASAAFARALPGLVTYVPVPLAGHVENWNADPSAYEQHLAEFLARLGRQSSGR
jgi:uncharacterized protein